MFEHLRMMQRTLNTITIAPISDMLCKEVIQAYPNWRLHEYSTPERHRLAQCIPDIAHVSGVIWAIIGCRIVAEGTFDTGSFEVGLSHCPVQTSTSSCRVVNHN
jgi:hypothetical protein